MLRNHLIVTRMSTNVQDELSTTVVDKYTQFQQTLVDISDAPSQKLKE
jgi:hypothetical protein